MKLSLLIPMLFIICLFLIALPCYAEDSTAIFYSGEVSFEISGTYNAGDTITADIKVINSEKFPISDAYLVVGIVEGENVPVYPSQKSDSENVIHEEKIEGLNLDSMSEKIVRYEYKLPSDISSGNYRMDVYLRTEKTPIVGIPHIFLSTRYASFTVKGTGLEPNVKILRTKTNIEGYTGPVGAPVEPSSEVTGTVYIEKSSASYTSQNLKVTVCRWDDTNGNDCSISKIYPLGDSSGTIEIPISFTAPDMPDAYAVRLEVIGSDGGTESLYRSRLIVTGETSKIRKLYADKKYYSSGETMTLSALIAGSPDHYTRPEVTGASLVLTVKDLSTGSQLFKEDRNLPEFTSSSIFSEQSFEFTVPSRLKNFKICADVLSSSGTKYDSYCVEYDASSFESDNREYVLSNISYDSDGHHFTADLCITDSSGMPLTKILHHYIIESGIGTVISSGNISVEECFRFGFDAKPDAEYQIIINDYDTAASEEFTLRPSDYLLTESVIEEPEQMDIGSFQIVLISLVILALMIVTIRKMRRD